MNVNIKHLSLSKTEHCVIIKVQLSTDENDYPYNHYMLKSEIPGIIDALRGGNEYTSRDVANYATFGQFGMYVITTSHISSGIGRDNKYDGYFKASQYTFPGNEFSYFLEAYVNYETEETEDLSHDLPIWKDKYAPIVTMEIPSDVRAKLAMDLQDNRLTEKPIDLVSYLKQWAKQYSNGNEICISISFDSLRDSTSDRPSNYYWVIYDPNGRDQKRIVNGGFIAHEDYKHPGMYSYSIHT